MSQRAPSITSLTNSATRVRRSATHHVTLSRGGVTAVIVDNAPVDVPELPGHRAGYNGVASLTHRRRPGNLFVPAYSGLNFEHIHDGTAAVAREIFEPRRSAMELRVVDRYTVELYQPPTANWQLESCGRFRMLEDGTIEYAFECVAHRAVFRRGFLGLFWASYIDKPDDPAICFRGSRAGSGGRAGWIRAVSPKHGIDSTYPPNRRLTKLDFDPDFPLALVSHRSGCRYEEPWYYGVSGGMAYVQMFRARDDIWFVQSPTGGGPGNPAWDFQWFVPDCQVGRPYGFVMRASYMPFEGREQVEAATAAHRAALNPELTD